MIPSSSWFPTNMADRAAWYTNFSTQVPTYGAPVLGLTAGDLSVIADDQVMMQGAANLSVTVETFRSAFVAWRTTVLEGEIGTPDAVFPNETFTSPQEVPNGLYQRLDQFRKRIMAAPTYTDEIGVALGLVSEGGGQSISAGDVQPEIQLFAAATGYEFSIVVSKRYDADSWQVWVTPVGEQKWTSIATATGKSTDIVYQPPATENPQPVQLQVRVQLRRSNQDYGVPSLIGQVTVNP